MENNKKNGKKTNKEKRVLIGALCVAAVMIAGSTFAWFTSQDEVTNRLSANADYNVSIVESFTPPKNWIPGQEIEKEVYATNTGNIGAFVEQDVSGVLTITVEKPVTTWAADCVELTEAERYSMEAGSYLAFKPDGSTKVLGEQAVSITPSSTDPNAYTEGATNFTPDADGLYVFRRSIGVDSTTRAETFEYAGYYYKSGKYYKTEITNVTPDTTADFAADGVSNDGNLTAATCSYFKEDTQVLNPASMVYDAANNRLVASYNTGISTTDKLIQLAQAYDSAIEDYERAAEAVARATNDSNNSSGDLAAKKAALDTAYSALQAALDAQSTAATNLANATIAKNNATATKNAAQAAVDASKTALYGAADGTETTATTDSLKGKYKAATDALVTANGRDQFLADFNAWAATHPNGKSNSDLTDYTYTEFSAFTANDQHQEYYTRVAEEKRAKEAYEAELTKLIGSTDPSATPTATSLQGQLNSATSAATAAEEAFNTAEADKNAADSTAASAQSTYDAALAAYNTAATANGGNSTDLANAQAALAAAAAAKNAAEKAYNDANSATPSDGILKININLSDNVVTAGGVADKWQMLPNPIANNVAKFYYTSILPGGATSTQLIKSVELDESATQDMYKSFDFDLNVALKSAQITYDTDNTTILTNAANETLDANATLTTPTSEASPITWTAKS